MSPGSFKNVLMQVMVCRAGRMNCVRNGTDSAKRSSRKIKMDPQATLQMIIDLTKKEIHPDYHWSDVSECFDNLANWLKKGGFPPKAHGPIFGTCKRAIGYPGMTKNSLPRWEDATITHVRSCQSNWKYALIMNPDESWKMVQYNGRGDQIAQWEIAQ
jgi:hypothetical protein